MDGADEINYSESAGGDHFNLGQERNLTLVKSDRTDSLPLPRVTTEIDIDPWGWLGVLMWFVVWFDDLLRKPHRHAAKP